MTGLTVELPAGTVCPACAELAVQLNLVVVPGLTHHDGPFTVQEDDHVDPILRPCGHVMQKVTHWLDDDDDGRWEFEA